MSISSDLFKMVPIGGVAAIFYRENIRQAATFITPCDGPANQITYKIFALSGLPASSKLRKDRSHE